MEKLSAEKAVEEHLLRSKRLREGIRPLRLAP